MNLKCKYCGSESTKNGQPYKNLSALNTHINVHCPKSPKKDASVSEACSHTFKLLNSSIKGHEEAVAKMIAAGNTKYCTKCGELQ